MTKEELALLEYHIDYFESRIELVRREIAGKNARLARLIESHDALVLRHKSATQPEIA